MNFKQALIAHLQGERVEKKSEWSTGWVDLFKGMEGATIAHLLNENCGSHCKFRIAPRTILCNGVEVVAGESVAPEYDSDYFTVELERFDMVNKCAWTEHKIDFIRLERGLVYLHKEDAIARAKAMLITTQGE